MQTNRTTIRVEGAEALIQAQDRNCGVEGAPLNQALGRVPAIGLKAGRFPEPLITIWEPKSYPVLLSFLSQGYTCPRKAMRNSGISMFKPLEPDALVKVNTQEGLERVQQISQAKKTLS